MPQRFDDTVTSVNEKVTEMTVKSNGVKKDVQVEIQ